MYQLVTGNLRKPFGVRWETEVRGDLLRSLIVSCTHMDPNKRISASDLSTFLKRYGWFSCAKHKLKNLFLVYRPDTSVGWGLHCLFYLGVFSYTVISISVSHDLISGYSIPSTSQSGAAPIDPFHLALTPILLGSVLVVLWLLARKYGRVEKNALKSSE